jgi:hypothetical protein
MPKRLESARPKEKNLVGDARNTALAVRDSATTTTMDARRVEQKDSNPYIYIRKNQK